MLYARQTFCSSWKLFALCLHVIGCWGFAAGHVAAADEPDRQLAFFEAKIRPVLIEHCYSCHAAESESVKGGLRLDSAAAMLSGGDSGPSLIKGKPDDSLLMAALRYDGLEMPPAGKLPEAIIRDFETWISLGAVDPRQAPAESNLQHRIDIQKGREFWSFQPIQDHAIPGGDQPASTGVDAFIDQALKLAEIEPVGEADPSALKRRLYFDLTGLPPGTLTLPAESDGWSVERLVDHLMNSPQFGVHWGRHWLDVARYADSNGGDFNATFHNAWRYRDYVVDSMNQDKPFQEFVREQLAGDLLPYQTDYQRAEQLIATGFLMIGTKMLSERDKEKLQLDVVDEQISTMGSAFLGMTLGCARCHDHKFDPIPTADYYALAGIFKSTRTLEGESQKYVSTWTRTNLPADAADVTAIEMHAEQVRLLEGRIKSAKSRIAVLEQKASVDSRFVVDDVNAIHTGFWKSSTLSPGFFGKHYIHDNLEDKGQKALEYRWKVPRSAEYEVRLSYTPGSGRAKKVPVTISAEDGDVTVYLDQTRKPTLDGMFAAVGRYRFAESRTAVVKISNAGTQGHVIADAVQFVEIGEDGQPIARSTDDESAVVELKRERTQLTELEQKMKQLKQQAPPPLPQAIAAVDLSETGDCAICVRGEHRNPGPVVSRGFLQVAAFPGQPEISGAASGRRELAEWVASEHNPLTARVIVNRVWYHLFGEGLVRSVDNFGELGERPTHPELLDHLAARFVTPAGHETKFGAAGLGWSLKGLIREIVLSDTYRRSSAHSEAAWQKDPENRLLWRVHRKRLTAESIRDSILAISGQLDLTPGGSPVEGLGTLVKSNSADAEDYERQDSFRRSLYLPIIRNELPSILTVFDFADPDLVTGKRPVTNVPAQALLLMNSPFIINGAQRVSERLCEGNEKPAAELIAQAYQIVLNRDASALEIRRGVDFLNSQGSEAGDSTKAAEHVAGAIDSQQLAVFVQALLASTDFRILN